MTGKMGWILVSLWALFSLILKKLLTLLTKLAPQYLCDLFTRNSHCSSYVLSNSETDLRLPMKKSSNGQKCFSYRGAKAWNDLPAETKQASSLNSLKKSIEDVLGFVFLLY